MRRLVVLGLLGGAVLLAPRMVLGQPAAPAAPAASAESAIDLSQLNLQVNGARLVDSIQVDTTDVKAEKGAKFIVVSLRGKLPAPGKVTVSASAFSALYAEVSEKAGNAVEKVAKAQAKAIDLGADGSWASSTTTTYPKPKNVLIDVALPVPAGVSELFLLYDTAKGKQRVQVSLLKPVR
jgi:hypothetical protein